MAIPPKIGGTLFDVICAAGAQRAEHLWMVFSRLAQPPVVDRGGFGTLHADRSFGDVMGAGSSVWLFCVPVVLSGPVSRTLDAGRWR